MSLLNLNGVKKDTIACLSRDPNATPLQFSNDTFIFFSAVIRRGLEIRGASPKSAKKSTIFETQTFKILAKGMSYKWTNWLLMLALKVRKRVLNLIVGYMNKFQNILTTCHNNSNCLSCLFLDPFLFCNSFKTLLHKLYQVYWSFLIRQAINILKVINK